MTPDEKFAKAERLVKTKDFAKVYKNGRSFKKEEIILKTLPNALPVNRIGFSISAKSIKKASRRNRIRRLLREAYRRNKKFLKSGFDMVLVVRRNPAQTFSYKSAEKIFRDLTKEAKVLS